MERCNVSEYLYYLESKTTDNLTQTQVESLEEEIQFLKEYIRECE